MSLSRKEDDGAYGRAAEEGKGGWRIISKPYGAVLVARLHWSDR